MLTSCNAGGTACGKSAGSTAIRSRVAGLRCPAFVGKISTVSAVGTPGVTGSAEAFAERVPRLQQRPGTGSGCSSGRSPGRCRREPARRRPVEVPSGATSSTRTVTPASGRGRGHRGREERPAGGRVLGRRRGGVRRSVRLPVGAVVSGARQLLAEQPGRPLSVRRLRAHARTGCWTKLCGASRPTRWARAGSAPPPRRYLRVGAKRGSGQSGWVS